MKDCIFCKIICHEIPAAKVYEDEKILAFLDINPVHKGHTLVIPKEHHQMMTDTPDELVSLVFTTSKRLMKAIKEATQADYVAISIIGIDVPHFHVHLIPRYFTDNFINWPTKKYEEGEMEEVAQKIKNQISKIKNF